VHVGTMVRVAAKVFLKKVKVQVWCRNGQGHGQGECEEGKSAYAWCHDVMMVKAVAKVHAENIGTGGGCFIGTKSEDVQTTLQLL